MKRLPLFNRTRLKQHATDLVDSVVRSVVEVKHVFDLVFLDNLPYYKVCGPTVSGGRKRSPVLTTHAVKSLA